MAQILRPTGLDYINNLHDLNWKDPSYYTTDDWGIFADQSDATTCGPFRSSGSNAYALLTFTFPAALESGPTKAYFRVNKIQAGAKMKIELRSGTTVLRSYTSPELTAWVDLNTSDYTITDYSNIKVKIIGGNTNTAQCSEVWLEVPDSLSGVGLEMGCNF